MPFVARYVEIMKDGFTGQLDWNTDVVGGTVGSLNVEVGVAHSLIGFPLEQPSPGLQVAVTRRVPNHDVGLPTVSQELVWDIPLVDATPVNTSAGEVFRYRRAISHSELGQTASVAPTPTLTYATLARPGGTSDAFFRSGVGGPPAQPLTAPRGRAVQPDTVGPRTGDKSVDRPDALALLQAGGLEVVDVTFIPSLAVLIDPLVALPNNRALIQGAANVFYYSGHGLGASNCLALEVPAGSHHFACWAKPADFVAGWRTRPELKVLIVAGCSVMAVDPNTSPVTGPGLAWADLLVAKGGHCEALLGYGTFGHQSPLDAHGGNEIAEAIGQRIGAGLTDYVDGWLRINADKHAWNACAWDGSGRFWWIDTPHVPFLWSLKSLQVV